MPLRFSATTVMLCSTQFKFSVKRLIASFCFLSVTLFIFVQHPSHSDPSLATGSSEVSLQTTQEKGHNFTVSPPQDLNLPMPHLCSLHSQPLNLQGPAMRDQDFSLLKRRNTTFNIQASRGHQRSQRSCIGGSISQECAQWDCVDPSDEDVGTRASRDDCRQTLNSEHLSVTLNSLSLTSLLSPGTLSPSLMKKSNSIGSLHQNNLSSGSKDKHYYSKDNHGFLAKPSVDRRARDDEEKEMEDNNIRSFSIKSSSRPTDTCSKKDR